MTEATKTLCPYCGVGCGLAILPPRASGKSVHRDHQGNPIWKALGDRAHPSNLGEICVKGATITEALDKSRLKHPMMRTSLDEPFRLVNWDDAYNRIVEHIQDVQKTQGSDAICMYGSGQLQTEDYYIAQKFMKGCLGTNNFDANSRLCMSSAVEGYIESFGSDGPPCCYEDLELTDCAFLIGTNTEECHPIFFHRLKKHHKHNRNVKMIVVDPRRTRTAKAADLHLAIKPGTDIDLLNGIAHLLLKWGVYDSCFIDKYTQDFSAFADILQYYPPKLVATNCGISVEELEQAARYWADSKQVLSVWSMGINQSVEGTAKVRTIINLHLMTGQIGKPGAGPFSLTGQPNAMGGRETGGLSQILPGYRMVKNSDHRATVERAWNLPAGSISEHAGLAAWDMIRGLEQGTISMLWVVATNPAVSMPDLERTKKALRLSPLTVCQDAYYPTETTDFAHIVLPASQWGEKTGTMTNSERVVTLCPAFRAPIGEAKADWEIIAEVGRRLGFEEQFAFENSAQVYDEFVQLTRGRPCDVTGLSHEHLEVAGPIQWPCRDSEWIEMRREETHPAKRMYTDLRFNTPNGRARFGAFHSQGLAEPPDEDYPLVLTVGRLYGHWHTMTRTGHVEVIMKMHPEPFLEIHPKDATRLDISDGMMVHVRSRRGSARFKAQVTTAIAPGTVFAPMHWGFHWAEQSEANALTHPEYCPTSLQPELKACAVMVTPVQSDDDSLGLNQTKNWSNCHLDVLKMEEHINGSTVESLRNEVHH